MKEAYFVASTKVEGGEKLKENEINKTSSLSIQPLLSLFNTN